jgi:ubiquinone/menaquinone biosynthesis C-methylase UbiE
MSGSDTTHLLLPVLYISSLTLEYKSLQLELPNETFETWNRIAGIYQDKFMDLNIYDATYDAFLSNIPQPDARILELACGPGNITRYILSKQPGLRVLGTDVAPAMVELAKVNNPTAQFLQMDARHIASLSQRFEGIIAGFCIPYLTPIECNHFLTDCATLLTPGGVLYLSFVEGAPDESGFKSSNMGRVFFNYHLLPDIEASLRHAWFNQIEISRVNFVRSETVTEQHTVVLAKLGM